MSETTNLQLKKHDNVSTNTNAFDIENYLNGNWDKIDTAYGNTTTNINAKYTKPVGGIPKTDLDSSVQTSLGKADTAIQTHQDISGKEDKSNKVTSISSESTNTQYPSAKLLYDKLAEKQTEIDSLQTDVEDLRNASYKVPGTGTDITLENTSENKFVEFGLEGRTEQEQLTGKNLFDEKNWYNTLHDIDSTSIILEKINGIEYIKFRASNSSIRNYKFMEGKFKENTQYVISAKALRYNNEVTSTGLRIAYTDGTSQENYISQSSEYDYVITSQPNKTINYINLNYANTDFALIRNIQLEEGSTATSYEPYCGGIPSPSPDFPQQIKNVTGNANVKIQNKNLFDEEIEYGSISPNGQPLPTQNCIRSKNFIEVKPETNYNLQNNSGYKGFIYLYDEDKSYLNYFTITSSSFNFITISSTKYIKFRSLSNENNLSTKYQLEQGSTATSYVPHQEQNYPFTFAEGQRGMQGTQPKDDGIHQKRKQKIFDGTENWLAFTSQGKTAYYINLPDGTGQEVKCSHFICQVGGGYPEKNKVLYNGTTNKNIVFYTGDTENKLTEWKAFLAEQYANGTPVIVEYELAESELENNIIPYNETQQAQYNAIKQARSYDDITYIISESDELGFNMNVVAVADANKVIDKELQEIKSAVIALGGDINV